MAKLELKDQLVLQVMAEIWEADKNSYAKWLEAARELEREERMAFMKGTFNYLVNVQPETKIPEVGQILKATRPGDERMQELVQQWEGVYPDSVAEAEQMGVEKGRKQGIQEGIEQGIEQGARQVQMTIAERMVRAGKSDEEIQQFTNITLEEIAQLRQQSS